MQPLFTGRTLRVLVLPAVAMACVSAWAGPRVGDIVGTPTPVSQTVNARVVSATPVIVMVINAVVAGAIVGLLLLLAGLHGQVATIGGVATFVVVVALHAAHGRRSVARAQSSIVVRFPGQPMEPTW